MYANNKGLFGSAPQMPSAKPREGISGTRRAIGILGDALLGLGGQQGVFGPMMAQRRMLEEQRAFAVQQGKTERDARMQDWMAQQDYARANPAPREPDAFERALVGAGIDPASPEGQAMFRDRAASMARDPNDQFVTVTIPGRGTYAGPQSGLSDFAGGSGGPRPGTVEDGFRFRGGDPADQRNWEPVSQGGQPMSAPRQQPQMTVTPRELDALVRRFGPEEVQARINSGQVAVRSN